MARCITTARADLDADFEILEDEAPLDIGVEPSHFRRPAAPAGIGREILEELPIVVSQNRITSRLTSGATAYQDPCLSQNRGQTQPSSKTNIQRLKNHVTTPSSTGSRVETSPVARSRFRRPVVDSETFQHLDSVREEASLVTEKSHLESQNLLDSTACQGTHIEIYNPLNSSISDQVKRHLAGQFDWLLAYPTGDTTEYHKNLKEYPTAKDLSNRLYGCNLVLRKSPPAISNSAGTYNATDSYYMLATPLEEDANSVPGMDQFKIVVEDGTAAWDEINYPATPLKVPEIVQAVESAVSPSLTVVSDRSCSFGDGSSRTGSFSLSRIEDSLEELDKLEDELEALNDFTRLRRMALSNDKQSKTSTSLATGRPNISKRASVACLSAAVLEKTVEKVKTPLRRSTSLTIRNNRRRDPEDRPCQQSSNGISRSKGSGTQNTAQTLPARGTKPPTVAKFELPGEAVARRLKDQREARQTQQAEAHKVAEAPSKYRAGRPLAKPTFELPGEVISRRKREEQEAKLRAQEAEERRRREFKARPMKPTSAPSTVPRDTIASRARQAKIQEEVAEKLATASVRAKRLFLGSSQAAPATPTAKKPQQLRGRNSMLFTTSDSSRAASTSTGSMNGNRTSATSTGEGSQQRLTGKEVYVRDNNAVEKKDRERRERELAAKAAREQAAERSRMASREWAEKKRRKQAALKQATQQARA